VAARIEASCNGLDIRYVVTNIRRGSAEWLYDTLYCERGQAENLIRPRSQPRPFHPKKDAAAQEDFKKTFAA
jgi:hypothetical protein